MNIHIISTPNSNMLELIEIHKVLSQISGELEFMLIENFLNKSFLELISSKFVGEAVNTPLEFEEFFNYCNLYRASNNFKEEDLVVFITNTPNRRRHFSAVENHNIFIYPKFIYEEVDEKRKVYAVAHNVLVNVFQSILGISYGDDSKHPGIIHKRTRGCINDYCEDRSQIILKLRTGFICDDCLDFATERQVSNDTIIQIYLLLKSIREGFSNLDRISDKFEPDDLIISENGKIYVGEKELILTVWEKSILIYFSIQPNGQKRSEINLKLFNFIYQKVHFLSLKDIVGRRITFEKVLKENPPISEIRSGNFRFHKHELNTRIKKCIGQYKAKYYILNTSDEKTKGKDQIYKIDLEVSKIKNSFTITDL